jgi:glycerol-3-phosphate dehydrogenase
LEHADANGPLSVYGSDARLIRDLVAAQPQLGQALQSRLPYLKAQVVWAARHESARTVEDVLARRTRALFLDARASIDAAPEVSELLRQELGRDTAWRDAQIRAYAKLASGYLLAPENRS